MATNGKAHTNGKRAKTNPKSAAAGTIALANYRAKQAGEKAEAALRGWQRLVYTVRTEFRPQDADKFFPLLKQFDGLGKTEIVDIAIRD